MHQLNTRKTKKVKKGFMLPDVMIAVFVTVTALVAILAALSPLLKSEFFKRDEIIATGLAQEGIELVRNTREQNWKSDKDAFTESAVGGFFPESDVTTHNDGGSPAYKVCTLLDGTTHCGDAANGVDVVDNCPTGQFLKRNNTGVYIGDSETQKFKRTIKTCKTSDNSSARVVFSIVTWESGASTHTVTLQNFLYNWGDK